MSDGNNRSRKEKDVSKGEKQQTCDQTDCEQNELDERRFRFRRKECGATLEKIRERARERDQTADETGLARSTLGRRIFARHSANRDQRRKISPRTNPTPSAVKIALVGFSRTYSSASS